MRTQILTDRLFLPCGLSGKARIAFFPELFGLGKDKDWALLANDFDKTLIRNRITSWLGDEIGLPFTPQSVPADFVMIGVDGDDETYREYLQNSK